MNKTNINIPLDNYTKAFTSKKFNFIDTNLCNKYTDIHPIDLNRIKLHSNRINQSEKCNKTKGYFDKSRIYKIVYKDNSDNNIDLCNITYLSEGAYGTVYRYNDKKEKYFIAVKDYYDNDDDEIEIYKLLIKKNIDCNIINMKIIKYSPYISSYYVGIMDYMDGPLSLLIGKMNNQIFLPINKQVAVALKCLNDNDLSYTDLKTDNILFKCYNSNKIKIVLGDIGSICKRGNINSCTWLPLEAAKSGGFPKIPFTSLV